MRVQQINWTKQSGWSGAEGPSKDASLVLYFGSREALACGARYDELRQSFPSAHIVGCSTGGQISKDDISDDEVVAAAIGFDATKLRLSRQEITDPRHSRECGEAIGRDLFADDLAGVFVLSDGLNVNGSELVAGLRKVISADTSADRGPCRRRRRFQANFGRGRLRAARAHRCRGRPLRQPPSASGTAAPAAGICSARAGTSQNPPAMFCSSSTASRRSIFTSAISDRRNPKACRVRRCCFRSRFMTRKNRRPR